MNPHIRTISKRAAGRARRCASLALATVGLMAAPLPVHLPDQADAASAACRHRFVKPDEGGPRRAAHATICMINVRRAHNGLPRLGGSRDLKGAARYHSGYEENHHCFS